MAISSQYFDIPDFAYFESGNIYAGSLNEFRFRLAPNTKEQVLEVISYSDTCFEGAERFDQAVFPLTAEGVAEGVRWAEQAYESRHLSPRDLSKGHLKASTLRPTPTEPQPEQDKADDVPW